MPFDNNNKRWWKGWWSRSKRFSKPARFDPWNNLCDDLQVRVLSFVAIAPYEHVDQDAATLTKSWPYVSKHFFKLSRSPELWELCLERGSLKYQSVWKRAQEEYQQAQQDTLAKDALIDPRQHYQDLLQNYIRSIQPVFCLPFSRYEIPLNYQLFFFEPRYQLMIRELLANSTKYFCHAHGKCRSGAQALLVEITSCRREDVQGRHGYFCSLHVVAMVTLERVWVRPQTGGLATAQVRRVHMATPCQACDLVHFNDDTVYVAPIGPGIMVDP